jgi:hypothetical protein
MIALVDVTTCGVDVASKVQNGAQSPCRRAAVLLLLISSSGTENHLRIAKSIPFGYHYLASISNMLCAR